MAIILNIHQPEKFVAIFKKEIDEGVIKNWSYDDDGDFTLTNTNFSNKAWFHPYITKDEEIIFGILGRKNVMLTITEYSLYHSAMVETMILFYSKMIDRMSIVQPMLSDYDTHSIDYGKYE